MWVWTLRFKRPVPFPFISLYIVIGDEHVNFECRSYWLLPFSMFPEWSWTLAFWECKSKDTLLSLCRLGHDNILMPRKHCRKGQGMRKIERARDRSSYEKEVFLFYEILATIGIMLSIGNKAIMKDSCVSYFLRSNIWNQRAMFFCFCFFQSWKGLKTFNSRISMLVCGCDRAQIGGLYCRS